MTQNTKLKNNPDQAIPIQALDRKFKNPFIMTLDGTTGVGEIYQPEEEEELVTMDEEESSGI